MGHPDHELLFVATQVAKAAGLKDAKHAISQYRSAPTKGQSVKAYPLGTLVAELATNEIPRESSGKKMRTTTVVMPESEVYQLLLRSRAPQVEPFRRWVTEEVLPTIRKTGRHDASESTGLRSIDV